MLLFEEASLTDEADGSLVIEAPWMRTKITDWQGPRTESHLYAYPPIQKLPFWYHPPRVVAALPPIKFEAKSGLADLEQLFERADQLIAEPYSWNLENILGKAHCPHAESAFDPFAAYSVLQRYVLRDSLALNQLGRMAKETFVDKADLPSAVYSDLLTELVHFSYGVTRACPKILQAAKKYPRQAGETMARFIESERGHEHFAINSLKLLTADSSQCRLYPVRPELTLLLSILEQCAAASPLGLAACLFCFEGLSYDAETWSPWTSLEALDRRHRQIGVGRHARINESERHGEIGFELARQLPVQSFEDLCVAARLAELCVKTRLRLFTNVLKDRLDSGTCKRPGWEASTESRV